MKLRPTQFYDPEPQKEDFEVSTKSLNGDTDGEAFNKYHSEWKARQVKPEFGNFKIDQKKDCKFYSSSEEYQKELQHYEENKLRYVGFRKEESFHNELAFTNDLIYIIFRVYDSGQAICSEFQIIDVAVYRGENTTTELIEKICEVNNIKLEKL